MRQEDEGQVWRERVLPLHRQGETCRRRRNRLGGFDRVPSQVQLSLGDFVAARRSLKKALVLGSQQPLDRQAVKKAFKHGDRTPSIHLQDRFPAVRLFITWLFSPLAADRGSKLEEELGEDQGVRLSSHEAVEVAEQLGDLYCKVGCYSKALDAYRAQVSSQSCVQEMMFSLPTPPEYTDMTS